MVFGIVGCATNQKNIPINLDIKNLISYPNENLVVKSSIGNTLVKKGYVIESPGYKVETGILIDRTNNKLYPCSRANTRTQKSPISYKKLNGDMCATGFILDQVCPSGSSKITHSICHSEKNNKYYLDTPAYIDFAFDSTKASKVIITNTYGTEFTQEFIYNGKVENNIKFIYREFTGNLARPAFSQEVQYDANGTNQIAFKNMILEIIEANNQSITYKLISNF